MYELNDNPFEDAFVDACIEDGVARAGLRCANVRERQAVILKKSLTDLAEAHAGRLLLDLCGVVTMSAACFADLIELQNRCGQLGGRFVIYGLSPELHDALRGSGLIKKLNAAKDEPDARRQLHARPARTGGLFGLFRKKAA